MSIVWPSSCTFLVHVRMRRVLTLIMLSRGIAAHKRDIARAEDALMLPYGTEVVGMQRDWNEELQSCREFSRDNLQDRWVPDIVFSLCVLYADVDCLTFSLCREALAVHEF